MKFGGPFAVTTHLLLYEAYSTHIPIFASASELSILSMEIYKENLQNHVDLFTLRPLALQANK